MNQNGNYPNNNRQSGSRPAGQRPAGSTQRPAGSTQRTTAQSAQRRPVTSQPKSQLSKTTIIGLVLLALFLLCFTLYSCQFLTGSPDNPPETTPSTDEPPVTDPSSTDEPPVTDPPETKPPVTDPPTEPGHVDPPADALVVVLDPGHGFWDGGCSNEALGDWVEKTLTIDICGRIAPILRSAGVYVIYTHDGSTFPNNDEIAALAAESGFSMEAFARKLIKDYGFDKNDKPVNENDVWNAFAGNLLDTGSGKNIFNVYERAYYISALAQKTHIDAAVSVHVNSVDVTNPNIDATKFHGMTVSYCTSNDQRLASMKLQKSVSDALAEAFPEKRVIRYADPWYDSLVICKYSAAPTILIETGYATDPTDAADFCDEAYRQKLAETIAAGILASLS